MTEMQPGGNHMQFWRWRNSKGKEARLLALGRNLGRGGRRREGDRCVPVISKKKYSPLLGEQSMNRMWTALVRCCCCCVVVVGGRISLLSLNSRIRGFELGCYKYYATNLVQHYFKAIYKDSFICTQLAQLKNK